MRGVRFIWDSIDWDHLMKYGLFYLEPEPKLLTDQFLWWECSAKWHWDTYKWNQLKKKKKKKLKVLSLTAYNEFSCDLMTYTYELCEAQQHISLYMFAQNKGICICIFTPSNVVRGNQNYANEIPTGAYGHGLQSVDRMSTNLLSRYLQNSKSEIRQFGNVVPNCFHFYTRLITKLHGKNKLSTSYLISCLRQIYPITPCSW